MNGSGVTRLEDIFGGSPAVMEAAARQACLSGIGYARSHASMDDTSPLDGRQPTNLTPGERMALAIQCTEQALACADDPDQYDKAERLLASALKFVPKDETIRDNYVGFCTEVAGYYLEDEDLDGAIRYLRRVLRHAPHDTEAWLDLGTAYARKDMPMEALQAWQKCLECPIEKGKSQRECIEVIGANMLIIGRAFEQNLPAKMDKVALRTVIARLIAAMRASS